MDGWLLCEVEYLGTKLFVVRHGVILNLSSDLDFFFTFTCGFAWDVGVCFHRSSISFACVRNGLQTRYHVCHRREDRFDLRLFSFSTYVEGVLESRILSHANPLAFGQNDAGVIVDMVEYEPTFEKQIPDLSQCVEIDIRVV